MKKILLLIVAIFAFSFQMSAMAETTWTNDAAVNRVNTIGKKLLEKNELPTQITFQVIETDEINAFANGDNQICVYTGLLNYVSDDSELAGVISHEIGHILNNHVAKQAITSVITATALSKLNLSSKTQAGANVANELSLLKMSRTQENEADVTGVDLMQKAGYNPLAMVSVLYKISGNYFDFTSTHPSGDKRTMYVFDYITYSYPDALKSNYTSDSYKKFLEYATPILNERNSKPKKLASFNKKQAKLKAKREKKIAKYKSLNAFNAWSSSYNLLKSLSGSSTTAE